MYQANQMNIKKCLQSNHDPRLPLLQIQTTPINHELQSPAELLGRKMCGLLTTLPGVCNDQIHEALEDKQEQMKLDHNNKLSDRSEPEILPISTQLMVQREDTVHGLMAPSLTTIRLNII